MAAAALDLGLAHRDRGGQSVHERRYTIDVTEGAWKPTTITITTTNNDKPPRSVRLAIGHPSKGPVISITTYFTVDLETIF